MQKNVEVMGADALIAVNSLAGGHAGRLTPEVLIPLLLKHTSLPVISAGGVRKCSTIATHDELRCLWRFRWQSLYSQRLKHLFPMNTKNALVEYGEEDIVNDY